MKKGRIKNLKKVVMESFKINDASEDEIIKVCNNILKELKWGIEY